MLSEIIGRPLGNAIGRPMPKHEKIANMVYDKEKLHALRKAKGWSQTVLAKRARLSQPTISALEQGEEHVKHATLVKIAAALQVPLRDLMAAKKNDEGEDIDQVIALCVSLDPRDRAAWIAAGRAILEQRKK